MVPGSALSARDTHFRISYAAPDEVIGQGIEALGKMAGDVAAICVDVMMQIEAVRLRVGLEIATALPRGLKKPLHVHIVGRAFSDQPAGRVGEDIEIPAV